MADAVSSNVELQLGSYADYIHSTYGLEKDDWLQRFLRGGYAKRYWEARKPSIEIYILDSVNETLQCETFIAPRRGPVSQAFLDALQSSSPKRRTRLILLQCGQLGDTNGSYIDAIGRRYMPNPGFFSAHFDLCRDLAEAGSYQRSYAPAQLPSERRFVQIITDKNSHMTATWYRQGDEFTFIVLGLDHFGNRITELRDELLKIKIPAEVRKLDDKPADYLFPYIRNSARTSATLCARHAHFGTKSSHGNGVTSFDWEWNQSNRRELISSMNSLQRFVTFPEIESGARPLRLKDLLPDYAVLIEETQVIGSDLQGILQQQANSAVMGETKRGIAQADSVRRLTLVAFVFIPLSFASSFFGMNLKQLGTGKLNIGYFFLLAFLAGGLSLALAMSVQPLEAAWARARRQYALREYEDDDKDLIASITKRQISYAYLRRRVPPAQLIHDKWEDTKGILADEFGGPYGDPDEVPTWRTLWFTCHKSIRKFAQMIKLPKLFVAKSESDATPDVVES